MHFVGVDPSLTNTGVVVLDAQGNLVSAHNTGKLVKGNWGKGVKDQMLRMECIAHTVLSLVPEDSCVGYEDYSFDSVNQPYTTGELGGILRLHLVRVVQDFVLVAPKSLKKFGTNLGSADKNTMIVSARAECSALGVKPTNDVCDAYFLAKYAWYRFAPKHAVEFETNRELLRARLELIKRSKGKRV